MKRGKRGKSEDGGRQNGCRRWLWRGGGVRVEGDGVMKREKREKRWKWEVMEEEVNKKMMG